MSLERARALVEVRRWAEAEQALAAALADPAAGAEPWCLLAQARLGRGDVPGARAAAERATSLAPDSEWPHRLRAMALLRAGRTRARRQAAVEAAERAVALAPGLDAALYVLTLTHLRRGSREARATARAVAGTNLRHNPHSTLALGGASLVELAEERWGPAEELARQGLVLAPLDPELLRHLARALDGQGRSREAGDLLAATARENPGSDLARRELGDLGSATIGRHLQWWQWVLLTLVLLAFSGILLPGLLVWLAVRWVKHARARAKLPPALRRIAVRERRRARAPALGALAAVLLVAALLASAAQAWATAGIWLLLALAPATLWWRWREPRPGDWVSAVQSSLRRLR